MCGGTGEVTTPGVRPKAQQKQLDATVAPDITDVAVQASQRAAARRLALKQGQASTFLTNPGQPRMPLLGWGSDGGPAAGDGSGNPKGGQ